MGRTRLQFLSILVLDNVGYHKSRGCRRWWEQYQRWVRPFWLPVYTPELNLMDRVWRFVKDKLSCHRRWADFPALKEATRRLLRQVRARFTQGLPSSFGLVQNFCEVA